MTDKRISRIPMDEIEEYLSRPKDQVGVEFTAAALINGAWVEVGAGPTDQEGDAIDHKVAWERDGFEAAVWRRPVLAWERVS